MKTREWPTTGSSNGHEWFKPDWLFVESCRICGIVRRADDANKPCKGPVPMDLREAEIEDDIDFENPKCDCGEDTCCCAGSYG